jgi:A118 family predicted phage portal protein
MARLITEVMNKSSDTQIDICLNSKMAYLIELWSVMYQNEAPWINNKTIYSSNLPVSISSEISRLVTLELKSEISGSPRADYLNGFYQKVLADLRQYVEYGCAKGGLIFKPYVTTKGIQVQYIQADCFFPISFDSSGNIIHCVFVDQFRKGKQIYTRLEIHELNNNQLIILNRAFVSSNDATLGNELAVSSVPQWSEMSDSAIYEGIDILPFGYFKIPLANADDSDSPLGVSVFSRAIGLIRKADEMYSNIHWEYEAKQAAVHIATSLLKYDKDNNRFTYPGGKERLYREVEYNTGATDKPLIDVYSPEIRDQSLYNGFNNQLKRIEFNCNLAYGTLSDPQNVEKTAEEIKTSKQRSYTFVSDTQMALQSALEDMIKAMDFWTTIYNLAPQGNIEKTFDWDDSIIVDSDLERKQDMQDVSMGVMSKLEYRMKWYGETEEQAKKMLPEEADLIE